MFFFRISNDFLSFSINVTCEAPRDKHSIQKEPLPEKTSRMELFSN